MPDGPRYLVDTNILLRLSKKDDPYYGVVQRSTSALMGIEAQLCYAPQNISEFWNVCTRPASHNGFGLSIEELMRASTQLKAS